MLVRMPRRTKKSSSPFIPALEMSSVADPRDAASRHADHLEEWRVAAKELGSAYEVWCAATSRDRRRCYASFVDAFLQEEMAARRVQHGAPALDYPDASPRRA